MRNFQKKRQFSILSPAVMGNKSSKTKKLYGTNQAATIEQTGHAALHNGPILHIHPLKPDWVLTCSDDKRIGVINVTNMQKDINYTPSYLQGHQKAVNRAAALSNGSSVLSVSRDLSLRKVTLYPSLSIPLW
jgi:hypothetical protein